MEDLHNESAIRSHIGFQGTQDEFARLIEKINAPTWIIRRVDGQLVASRSALDRVFQEHGPAYRGQGPSDSYLNRVTRAMTGGDVAIRPHHDPSEATR